MTFPEWTSDCGTVRLINADCLQVLPTLAAGSVDAVVTDPPYGIAHKSNGQRFRNAKAIAGDDSLDSAESVRAWAKEIDACCLMFFSPYRPMSGWRNVLCWAKGAHVGIGGDRATCWKRDFEMIGVENNGPLWGARDSAVLRFNAVLPPPSGHFAEKPVDLMVYLVNKIQSQQTLDPFMGSGTTGVACVKLGRKFIGIEIDPGYFEIAKQRIQKALADKSSQLIAS